MTDKHMSEAREKEIRQWAMSKVGQSVDYLKVVLAELDLTRKEKADLEARLKLVTYEPCECGSKLRNVCCRNCGRGCDRIAELEAEVRKLNLIIDALSPRRPDPKAKPQEKPELNDHDYDGKGERIRKTIENPDPKKPSGGA